MWRTRRSSRCRWAIPTPTGLNELADIPQHYLKEIEHFFRVYKDLEGTHTETRGFEGATAARTAITRAMAAYQEPVSRSETGGPMISRHTTAPAELLGGVAAGGGVVGRLLPDLLVELDVVRLGPGSVSGRSRLDPPGHESAPHPRPGSNSCLGAGRTSRSRLPASGSISSE